MAGLIKGQILKHLSKFAKNLSPNSINLSTLRGEGELRDLELNEAVLTDVLDLPTWLLLTKATCNRVSIKIQWTKLKSQPICLYLDEVEVTMETCDDPREPVPESVLAATAGPSGKYGLAESIIDGMYVSINSVLVNFKAKTFMASIQLSRIIIESKTPTWHNTESLRMTRIKDERRGEILIFKEAEWMTLRIEANALEGVSGNLATTPLRLIANQSKIRITIKKRLIDCGIIASRLQINLDDLLWVLTDSQLKAALVFVNSLKDVVAKSARLSKKLAAERLKRQGFIPSPVHSTQYRSPSNRPGTKAQQAVAKVFNKFDIKETSYHLYTGRVDLHLCDDAAPEDESHRRKVEGGAMQVTLFKMGLDFYPYHPAGTDRSHWVRYDKNSEKRDQWAADLFSTFKEDVRKVREAYLTPQSSPAHGTTPEGQVTSASDLQSQSQPATTEHVLRAQGPPVAMGQGQLQNSIPGGNVAPLGTDVNRRQAGTQGPPQGHPNGPPQGHVSPQGQRVPQLQAPRPTKLLESCVVFRLEDFALYRVSTALDHKRRVPTKFMTSDKQRLFLPQEMSSLHAEFTEYYFPEGIDYPVPQSKPTTSAAPRNQNLITVDGVDDDFVLIEDDCFLTSFVPHSNMFAVINPIYLKMDFLTVLWLNAFLLNLMKKANIPESEGPKVHVDVKVEALMPRIVVPAESPVEGQSDRPTGLQIQSSQICITNCRIGNTTSKFQLLKTLDEFNRGRLFKDNQQQFPRDKDDLICVPPCFSKHLDKEDSPYFDKTVESVLRGQGIPGEMQRATNELLNPLKKSQSTTGLMYYNMMADSFKVDATKDIWSVMIDQFWLEFVGVPSSRNRPVPFIEAFPLTLWIARPLLSLHSESSITILSQSDSSMTPSSSGNSLDGDVHPVRSNSSQRLREFYSLTKDSLPNGPKPTFKTTNIGDTKPADKYEAQPVSRLGDIHMITNLMAKISIQLNHYQYLFLMRLIETVMSFMDEMEDDTLFIKKEKLPETKISISVIIKEVEVALVCPPIPEIPSLQISPEDSDDLFTADPQGKDSSGSQFLESQISDRGDSALGVSLQSGRSIDCSDGTLVLKSSSEMDAFSDGSQEVTSDLYQVPSDIPVAMMTSDHTDHSSPQIHISDSGGPLSQVPMAANSSRSGSPASHSPSHNSNGRVPHGGGHPPELLRKDSDLKKSFTAMANFTKGVAKKINKSVTDKVKQNMRSIDADELSVSDDLETMSTRSGSSDEDDYIMIKFQNQQEAPAFEPKLAFSDDASVAESCSEYRDEGGSMRNLSGPLDRAQGVVSVVCFKVHNSEVAISMKGKDVAVAATVDHVIPEEHGNVNLDKFHDRFINLSKENKSFSVESLPRLQDSPIRVRFIKGPFAEKLMPSASEKGFLRAEVLDFHAKFLTSTLSSLADLLDDEKPPDVLPMFVRVENTTVVIKDNKPPTHEIAAPTKEPVELFITKLHILRKEDGQFRMSAEELPAEVTGTPPSEEDKKLLADPVLMLSEVKTLRLRVAELEKQQKADAAKRKSWPKPEDMEQLQQENDQLRRHLEKIGKMSTSSGGFNIELLQEELEKWKDKAKDRKRLQRENEKLLEELSMQADELLMLKQERESLLATIGFLQEELSQSEQLRYKAK